MALLKRVSRLLEVTLAVFSGALLVGLTAIVVYAVAWRYLGGASPRWYDEVASILLVWLTYYAGALTALKRGHIAVDSVVLSMPEGLRMAATWFAEAVTIGFFVLLAWAGLIVLDVLSGLSLISLRWMPLSVAQSVIPIGAALFIVAQLLSLPEHLAKVRSGISKEQEEIDHALAEAERIEREAGNVFAEAKVPR